MSYGDFYGRSYWNMHEGPPPPPPTPPEVYTFPGEAKKYTNGYVGIVQELRDQWETPKPRPGWYKRMRRRGRKLAQQPYGPPEGLESLPAEVVRKNRETTPLYSRRTALIGGTCVTLAAGLVAGVTLTNSAEAPRADDTRLRAVQNAENLRSLGICAKDMLAQRLFDAERTDLRDRAEALSVDDAAFNTAKGAHLPCTATATGQEFVMLPLTYTGQRTTVVLRQEITDFRLAAWDTQRPELEQYVHNSDQSAPLRHLNQLRISAGEAALRASVDPMLYGTGAQQK